MSQERLSNLTIEELIKIATSSNDEFNELAKVETRTLKDVEVFFTDLEIKPGRKTVHNLIVYDLYRSLVLENPLKLLDFNKSFSFYFPRVKDTNNNWAYKLSPNHKNGRFDLSAKHLKKCRELYGIKKQKSEGKTIQVEVPGTGPKSESDQS